MSFWINYHDRSSSRVCSPCRSCSWDVHFCCLRFQASCLSLLGQVLLARTCSSDCLASTCYWKSSTGHDSPCSTSTVTRRILEMIARTVLVHLVLLAQRRTRTFPDVGLVTLSGHSGRACFCYPAPNQEMVLCSTLGFTVILHVCITSIVSMSSSSPWLNRCIVFDWSSLCIVETSGQVRLFGSRFLDILILKYFVTRKVFTIFSLLVGHHDCVWKRTFYGFQRIMFLYVKQEQAGKVHKFGFFSRWTDHDSNVQSQSKVRATINAKLLGYWLIALLDENFRVQWRGNRVNTLERSTCNLPKLGRFEFYRQESVARRAFLNGTSAFGSRILLLKVQS